ncbi:hypothetical protein JL721_4072 [Aureococcus anophagefferens]|nr:hypothetical protein JL721_4072 [Aureococcus anophagefferens]
MTFADGDGSLGAAGVLFPRRGDGAGNSVVLSLAGVGVSAQAQADAYKRKVDEADADYTFGFEDLWVLCPDRAGPTTGRTWACGPRKGREEYGDANNLWTHETAPPTLTALLGTLQGATYGGRFGLRVLDRPDPGARAFATFKANGTLETRNARRLALAGEAWRCR